MTEYEIISLLNELAGRITDQFNFWMATTFAVVVATCTAGNRMNLTIRFTVAMLYLSATALFLMEYLSISGSAFHLIDQLRAMNSDYPNNKFGTYRVFFRRLVMLAGTVLTVYLIFKPNLGRNNRSEAMDE